MFWYGSTFPNLGIKSRGQTIWKRRMLPAVIAVNTRRPLLESRLGCDLLHRRILRYGRYGPHSPATLELTHSLEHYSYTSSPMRSVAVSFPGCDRIIETVNREPVGNWGVV